MRIPFDIPHPGSRPFDVVGLGLNSIDLVAVVDEFPKNDTKQPLKRLERLAGGQIATALSVCARLGWRGRYLGSFGDDEFGEASRQSLVDAGVDVSEARITKGATNQFAVVLVDERSGTRTVLWNRHPALNMDASEVREAAATSGRMMIVDCHETAAVTAAATFAKQVGIPTVVDVEKVRPGIDALLQQIDAIIAAQDFPSALTGYGDPGRALEAIAQQFNAPVVCVTLGREGSLARCGGREIRTPAYAVTAVDTTGAGDAFRGGFTAACLSMPDGEIETVLEYANAVAALNCRKLGARGGIPTVDEVRDLMAGGAKLRT